MDNYFNLTPNEMIQEISLYLDHISIIKLRKITNKDINFQTLVSLKYPGFYKIFKIVREQSDNYRGLQYETGHSLVDQLGRFYQQSIIEDKNYHKIDSDYTNIYSDDIGYLILMLYENYPQGELNYIFKSYILLDSEDFPQKRLYKYRIEFPDTQAVKDEFSWSCDQYFDESINFTTFEGRKKFLSDNPLVYSDNISSMELGVIFLMLLEYPETVELYRNNKLTFIRDEDVDFDAYKFQDYLVLFNRVQEYIQSKLK